MSKGRKNAAKDNSSRILVSYRITKDLSNAVGTIASLQGKRRYEVAEEAIRNLIKQQPESVKRTLKDHNINWDG